MVKFIVCCLLAIASSAVMGAPTNFSKMKLKEIKLDLGKLNVLPNVKKLYTPSKETCCIPSALQCIKKQLEHLPGDNSNLVNKIRRKLTNQIFNYTAKVCSPQQAENVTCQECESYEMKDSRDFVNTFENLLEMIIVT
ncbi:interleukin-21 [Amia ocellicauda]|uniref:interleukin-21 n=1 Tax=Amia ocellicauda TaxID=2972642 RepID=UPI0034649614